jgi:hypothetical protein
MRRLSQTVLTLAVLAAYCAAADLDPRKLSGGAATVETSGAGAYTRRAPLLDNVEGDRTPERPARTEPTSAAGWRSG